MKKIIIIILLLRVSAVMAQDRQEYPGRKFISADSLLTLLNNFYLDSRERINPYFLPRIKEVNDTIKHKLLSLLKREWTEKELKYKVEKSFKHEFEYLNFQKILEMSESISKECFYRNFSNTYDQSQINDSVKLSKVYFHLNDSVYRHVYDSTALNYRNEIEKKIREAKIADELVLTAGVLHLKEAIPILRNDLLSTTKHYFNKESAEISMAGLGDIDLQKKYIKKYEENVILNRGGGQYLWKDFLTMALIIHTQESISKLADWMDTTKYYYASGGEGDYRWKVYSGSYLVPYILGFIKNKSLKEGFMKVSKNDNYTSYYDEDNASAEQILFLRKWLIENKGKYEFD